MCEAQQPVIEDDQQIVFTRTVRAKCRRSISPADWQKLTDGRTLHELGPISNICADWGMVLSQGLLGRQADGPGHRGRLAGDPQAVEFLDAAIETIDAVLDLAGAMPRRPSSMAATTWPRSSSTCRPIRRARSTRPCNRCA